MAKRNLPSPLYKPGDVVYLKCSRKGLGIGNTVFGKVIKRRWHYGYDYWIAFKPKSRSRVIVRLHEGALGPRAEYAQHLLENKIAEIDTYKVAEVAYDLRDKIEAAVSKIQELKEQIREDKKRLKELKLELSKYNSRLKKIMGK